MYGHIWLAPEETLSAVQERNNSAVQERNNSAV
jgi:hypothetical protein